MPRYLKVAYLAVLLTLVVLGFAWDVPIGFKILVGVVAVIPVVVADFVIRRGRRRPPR